jgi:hypothetical protein
MKTLRDAIHQWLDDAQKLSNVVAASEFGDTDKLIHRVATSEFKPSYITDGKVKIRRLLLQPAAARRKRQNFFLESRAFRRALRWRDVSDQAIREAIDLLEFLLWVNKEWSAINASKSGNVAPPPSTQPAHGHTAALHYLAEARECMHPKFHAQADRLIKNLSNHIAKPEPSPHYA